MPYSSSVPPDDPPRSVHGRSVVEWGWTLKITALLLFLAVTAADGLLLLPLLNAGAIVLVFLGFNGLLLWLVLASWCSRIEFDDHTLIRRDLFGRSRSYPLQEVVARSSAPGPFGWRYQVSGGGEIYVNPYQRGGRTLIGLLDRYARQRVE